MLLTRMFLIENEKLTRRALFWGEMAALALTAVGMLALMLLIRQLLLADLPADANIRVEDIDLVQAEAFLTWPLSFSFVLSMLTPVGMMLALILGGGATAPEYSWRSFQLWLSRGVPRWQVIVAKFTAVSLATLLIVAGAILTTAVVSGLASLALLGTLPWASINWFALGLTILATTLALLPYAALGLLLAVASRSLVVTIGGGLAYVLLFEPLLVRLLPLLGNGGATVAQYIPNHLGQLLISLTGNGIATDAPPLAGLEMMPTPLIITLLLGYTALFVTTAVVLFQRQDLGG